jgi:hypothetical protein
MITVSSFVPRSTINLLIAAFATVAFVAPLVAFAQTVAVRFGQLVTGKGAIIQDAVVLIEKDRITAVGSGAIAVPAAARLIDLRPLTGIPGMIDVHTHMTFYWDKARLEAVDATRYPQFRRHRFPSPGKCPQDTRKRRHDGPRPGLMGRQRPCDAKPY